MAIGVEPYQGYAGSDIYRVLNRWKVFFTIPIRYTILHAPFSGNGTNITHGIGIALSLPHLDHN
ncbi:hypothetical protein BT69DRAFT_1359148 [Atractiella rhizophila]|nr:hypothetical protein BT69DRAFT_1359148 [Atractiella rhizophila]